jgi:hypothetical protein
MKENRKKAPPGWKVRAGITLGHGNFIGHFTMPDGFYFQNDMHQCHIQKGQVARDLLIQRAWELVDQFAKMKSTS